MYVSSASSNVTGQPSRSDQNRPITGASTASTARWTNRFGMITG
jgi:hypothetical protein